MSGRAIKEARTASATKGETMSLFTVEMINVNPAVGLAISGAVTLFSWPSSETNSGFVKWHDAARPVALFQSKEQAEKVALVCRRENQRFVIRPARGRLRADAKVVPLELTEWHGQVQS